MRTGLVIAAAAVLAVALLAAAADARPPKWSELDSYTFSDFVRDFGKRYEAGSAEYARREAQFAKRLAEVRAHNADARQPWKKGVNHMSDWAEAEFAVTLGGRAVQMQHLVAGHRARGLVRPHRSTASDGPLPKSVDWRARNPAVLTAVKNQGQCGSCWAHGAVEQMESYWAIATNQLFVLSTQQTTACTPNPNDCGGTGGCFGATAELGYERAVVEGLTEEWQYPYTAYWGTTGTCAPPARAASVINVTGYTKLQPNSQTEVMAALAHTGPLAVNVDASAWSSYESGVFTGCDYSKNITINHVVQLVGYGTDGTSGLDYWIVRNSWSPRFGENGFIRILRTATPACGISTPAQDGTGCKDEPTTQHVCGTCGILFDTSYPLVHVRN